MTLETTLLLAAAAVAAMYAVGAVAKWPQQLILVAVPLLLWPSTLSGQPIRQSVAALLIAGVIVGGRRKLRSLRLLLLALLGLTALLVASHYLRTASVAMPPTTARNSMITLVLNVWLVLAFALARPPLVTAVKVFALSGVLASAYSAWVGDASDGRLRSEGLNPNSAGHAAALATIACIASYQLSGKKRYLAVAVIPFYVMLLAQSRGGLVVLGVGLLVGWMLGKEGILRWLGAAAGLIAAWAFVDSVLAFAQRYLLFSRNTAVIETESRSDLLELAVRLMQSTPWGIGYGRFPDLSRPVLGRPLNSHNDWLRIAVEAGVVAGLLLLLVLVGRIRDLPAQGQMIVAAGATSMALGNVGVDLRVSLPLWAFAGLSWAAAVAKRDRDQESNRSATASPAK